MRIFYIDLDDQFLVRLLDNSDWWCFLKFLDFDWWWCLYLVLDYKCLVGFLDHSDDLPILSKLSSIHQPHCFWHLIRVSACFWDWPLTNFNFAYYHVLNFKCSKHWKVSQNFKLLSKVLNVKFWDIFERV